MNLTVLTACCGANEITAQWLEETIGRCTTSPELIIVSNGSTPDEVADLQKWVGRVAARLKVSAAEVLVEPEPMGSTAAFNLGIQAAHNSIVAMLHNDLMVKEDGWDSKVVKWFEAFPGTGVAGFHGSRSLGDPRIYSIPYELIQLARGDNWSNMVDAEAHGQRTITPMEVVTLDGLALIAMRRRLLDWGGMDARYVHHMMDHDLCLTARRAGLRNYLLPISVQHLNGQTANAARYNDYLESKGIERDQQIHRESHEKFYAKWQGTGMLPARI